MSFILCLGQTKSESGRSSLEFLKFGTNSQLISNDRSDTTSPPINIPNGFPFGGVVHNLAYVREQF